MLFYGSALRLDIGGIAYAASRLGVPAAQLQAVLAVETSGQGYDAQRRPTMLFEPHVFFRSLDAPKTQALLRTAVKQGLAYAAWGHQPYPADSYPRLLQAVRLDEGRALCAASWGLGQLMGGNYAMLGYGHVQDMVASACVSEGNQLDMLVRFLQHSGLLEALKQGDWETFARHYNGPGQVVAYADRLRAAYAKTSVLV